MSFSKYFFFNLSKKYTIFKKAYLYYNIYIRNFKYLFGSSQFGEDKQILKLFNKKGTYLDVGCFHPLKVNNTYSLYKLGWRGMNIDLNPLSIDLFNVARPNDINVCAAISSKKKIANLYFHRELSPLNTLTKEYTIFYKKIFGITGLKKKKIKTKTLNEILFKHNFKRIDFLNIDTEGHELEILKTLKFDYFDIRVICIEILSYTKKTEEKKKKIIFKFFKSKNYSLKFKSKINYIFVKKS